MALSITLSPWRPVQPLLASRNLDTTNLAKKEAVSGKLAISGTLKLFAGKRLVFKKAMAVDGVSKAAEHATNCAQMPVTSTNASTPHFWELQDTAFADAVVDDQVSIAGFGSLLSERSARFTFPDLKNFRQGRLRGFRRVFAHVAPVFIKRGIANLETKEMSSLSVEPAPGHDVVVTIFEISAREVPAFIERELEFRFLATFPEDLHGNASKHPAVVCGRYSDHEFRTKRCASAEEYHRHYGQYGIETIWRDDILPCRTYLRHCVLAARSLGEKAYDSFLDGTFLGDRVTTIRQHLAANPSIMDELPPPELRERYGG